LGDEGAHGDFAAVGNEDVEDAVLGRFEIGGDLVGFQGHEEVAAANGVAGLAVPAGDNGGGDGFTRIGDGDIDEDGKMGSG
jgi:hypothetical protein